MTTLLDALWLYGWLWLIPSLLIVVSAGWRLWTFEQREKAERVFDEFVKGHR